MLYWLFDRESLIRKNITRSECIGRSSSCLSSRLGRPYPRSCPRKAAIGRRKRGWDEDFFMRDGETLTEKMGRQFALFSISERCRFIDKCFRG